MRAHVLASLALLMSAAWVVGLDRLEPLSQANAAYARHDLSTALELYEQVAGMPPDEAESQPVSRAIDGLARFRALIALTSIHQEELAKHQLAMLVDSDPDAPLARLAAQFWDQYGMTASVRAACAQLAPAVDSQAARDLATLASLGIEIRPDELCVPA